MSTSRSTELLDRELEDLARIQDAGLASFLLRTYALQVILTVLMIPVALLFGWLADYTQLRAPAPEGDVLFELGISTAIIYGIIIGPLLETLMFQVLFVEVTRFFTKRTEIALYLVWFMFAVAHFTNSIESGVLAGIPGGLVFGLVYLASRRRSFLRALVVTFLAHALWNAPLILAAAAQIALSS